MEERRRHERFSVDLPVLLRHCGRIVPATALNLSCGGMYLRVEGGTVRSDQPIEVVFDLEENARDVSMRGTITRVESAEAKDAGVGVRFTNLFSLSHRAIQQYLHKHLN